jgi:hypothetical protein
MNMSYECDNDNHDIGCQCPGVPSPLSWEYGIRYDKVPSSPDMATGMAPQTHVMWLPNLAHAQEPKTNKAPLQTTNHAVVYRLVGPVEVYPG